MSGGFLTSISLGWERRKFVKFSMKKEFLPDWAVNGIPAPFGRFWKMRSTLETCSCKRHSAWTTCLRNRWSIPDSSPSSMWRMTTRPLSAGRIFQRCKRNWPSGNRHTRESGERPVYLPG